MYLDPNTRRCDGQSDKTEVRWEDQQEWSDWDYRVKIVDWRKDRQVDKQTIRVAMYKEAKEGKKEKRDWIGRHRWTIQ